MTQQTDPTTVDDTVLDAEISAEPMESTSQNPQTPQNSEEVSRLLEALARARADYDNLVRRSDEDRKSMGRFVVGNTIHKILPLADNLERALKSVPADIVDHAWVAGIRSVYDRLIKDLDSLGVRPFDSVGTEVDPDKHDVMSQGPWEAGTIIAEFERGYMLDDKVLRHAKVVAGAGEAMPL